MTPITRLYSHYLPEKIVPMALCITYTVILILIISFLGSKGSVRTLYLDIGGVWL